MAMLAASKREVLLERRQYTPDQSALWDKLSLAQKFAASSLNQYGYDLAFIRSGGTGSLAVLVRDDDIATVASDGDINTSPGITIR